MQPISTRPVEGPEPHLEVDDAELRVDIGNDKGKRCPLGHESLLIGSAPDCQLVLHDDTVSARHAEISLTPAGLVVRDLGAKNGTRLDGIRIDRAPLFDGAKLQLGTTRITVTKKRGSISIPLAPAGVLGDMVAHSVAMRVVAAHVQRLAPSDATLLIEGETGTGKEVMARLVHDSSPRRDGPFIVMDCGSVAPNLIASELFGFERGSFTGADRARPGLFEAAHRGTLFLDEIAELPIDLQPTLLRMVERQRTRRIGSSHEVNHDVRLIAATNRNLEEEVRAKRFRADLYYRLAVARLRLPPLRERREDIPILAQRIATELGVEISPELSAALSAHDWPGNIRELRNAIERAQLLSGNHVVGELVRVQPVSPLAHFAKARRVAADLFERDYLERVLAATDGNLSRAAEVAGVSRQVITHLARKHGMRARDRGV
jgi:DNA-binding NtrC family response regulator